MAEQWARIQRDTNKSYVTIEGSRGYNRASQGNYVCVRCSKERVRGELTCSIDRSKDPGKFLDRAARSAASRCHQLRQFHTRETDEVKRKEEKETESERKTRPVRTKCARIRGWSKDRKTEGPKQLRQMEREKLRKKSAHDYIDARWRVIRIRSYQRERARGTEYWTTARGVYPVPGPSLPYRRVEGQTGAPASVCLPVCPPVRPPDATRLLHRLGPVHTPRIILCATECVFWMMRLNIELVAQCRPALARLAINPRGLAEYSWKLGLRLTCSQIYYFSILSRSPINF